MMRIIVTLEIPDYVPDKMKKIRRTFSSRIGRQYLKTRIQDAIFQTTGDGKFDIRVVGAMIESDMEI